MTVPDALMVFADDKGMNIDGSRGTLKQYTTAAQVQAGLRSAHIFSSRIAHTEGYYTIVLKITDSVGATFETSLNLHMFDVGFYGIDDPVIKPLVPGTDGPLLWPDFFYGEVVPAKFIVIIKVFTVVDG